jgi:tetratricopeptide (TPR) repeat protein
MIRLTGRALALVALATLPTAALAQKEPAETKQTKEAQKFIGLALMRQKPEEKKPQFEQALVHLREGMTKDPGNARVWLLAGQVYSGLGDFMGADSAFKKAETLHPPYSEEISGEREVAWVEAFNAGIAAMDSKATDDAIKKLELAELMYPHRPEAKMNLGALYAGKNETDKAVAIFEKAIESTNGPLKDKLKPEDAVNWKRYAEMARLNIAQILGSRGVEQFEAKQHDQAIATFAKASEINPHSRDYLFNLAQSYYAKASVLEEKRKAAQDAATALTKAKKTADAKTKTEEANKFGTELLPLYDQIVKLAERTLLLDPATETLYYLIARAHRTAAEMAATPAEKTGWQNKALEILQKREALVFEVEQIGVQTAEGEATVTGTLKNLKAEAGAPLKIRLTLVGSAGAPIGSQEFTVSAPAKDQSAKLEGKVAITGEVAGWKYEVLK